MLTYIQINAAKPRAKAWNLSDSQNLYLVIQPNGSKLWRDVLERNLGKAASGIMRADGIN